MELSRISKSRSNRDFRSCAGFSKRAISEREGSHRPPLRSDISGIAQPFLCFRKTALLRQHPSSSGGHYHAADALGNLKASEATDDLIKALHDENSGTPLSRQRRRSGK